MPKIGHTFLSKLKDQKGGVQSSITQTVSSPGLEISQSQNVQSVEGNEALAEPELEVAKDQRPECGCSRETPFEMKSLGKECKSDAECISNNCEKDGILGVISPGKCAKIGGAGSVPIGHKCTEHSDCNDPKSVTSGNKSCIDGICLDSSKSETLPLDQEDEGVNGEGKFRSVTDLDRTIDNGKFRIIIDDVTKLYTKYLQLPNTSDSKQTKDKMYIEDKADTRTGKSRQKKWYRICDVTNQLKCSKLGKSSSKMKLGKSKNFVTRYKCCNEVVSSKTAKDITLTSSDDAICLRMTEPNRKKALNEMRGVCVNLNSKDGIDKLRLDRKIPDGSRCEKNANCISNYCQSTTKTCKPNLPIFTNQPQCSSMNPCMISEECDNGQCHPNILKGRKNESKTRKRGQICSYNEQCGSNRCTTEKPFRDILTKYKLKTAKLPIKRMLRLFQNTDCPSTHIKPNEFIYGTCIGDAKHTKKKDINKVLLEYHEHFLDKLSALNGNLTLPKLIFFNNFAYDKFDRTASFELFDYTSQTAIMLVKGKYVLAKFYYVLKTPFDDTDEEDYADIFNGHIFCFFIDSNSSDGNPVGTSLNKLSDRIKCYTNAKDLVPDYLKKKNVLYSEFPKEFELSGVFSPEKNTNNNVLLVTNLCMYEYLVTLLFGEKETTPLNLYDPDSLKKNKALLTTPIFTTTKTTTRTTTRTNNTIGNTRGFFQYSINYNELSTFELLAAEKEELLLLYYPGMYRTFDVPFTTAFKCGMTNTNKPFDMKNIFFGMDAFNITENKFSLAFNYWKQKLETGKFKQSSLHTNTEKYIKKGSSFGIKLIDKQHNTLDLLEQKNGYNPNEYRLLFLGDFNGRTDFKKTDTYSIINEM